MYQTMQGSSSNNSGSGSVTTALQQQSACDKQAEWAGFLAVLKQTEQLQAHLEMLKGRTGLLEDGGQGGCNLS